MKIETYSFGKMVIDGMLYTHDLIIDNHRIRSAWRRKHSHDLYLDDIPVLQNEICDVLIIGTGMFGLMKVDADVMEYCHAQCIKVIIKNTKGAAKTYNDLVKSEKHIIAAFHLTC